MGSKSLVRFGILPLILVLAACGGGGGGSPAPVEDQAPGGIWEGTWTGGSGGDEDAFAISTDIDFTTGEAEFNFILLPSLIQVAVTATVTGDSISGSGLLFLPSDLDAFPGGLRYTDFSFSGILIEGDSLDASWQNDAGESGSFSLVYDAAEHLRGASLDLVEGTWTLYDTNLNPLPAPFEIAAGHVSRVTPGCTTVGTVTIPDPAFNVYIWNATITSNAPNGCPVAGDYQGLGSVTDSGEGAAVDDEFDVLVSNEQRANPLLLLRD